MRRSDPVRDFSAQTANQIGREGILSGMRTNWFPVALFLAAALAWSPALTFSLPAQDNGAKKDVQKAGHETADAAKDTGHDVKKGTEKAYDVTKKDTKKVYHSTTKDTEKAYDVTKKDTKKAYHSTAKGTKKAWDKTKNTTKGAIHGGEEGAKQPQK